MKTLKTVVEKQDTNAGKWFDISTQVLIVVSLITFSLETLPDLTPTQINYLRALEVFIVSVFTIEYLLRILVADKKLEFIFSFFGMIDLLAIAPFYLATGVDLRALRALRLMRLFRVLKLVRYSAAIQRYHRAFLIAKEEIVLYLVLTLILMFIAATGIYHFEHTAQPLIFQSIPHCLWWSVATLTTVGYGDIYPITAGGKAFTFLMLLIGIGIVTVPAGLVASALNKARELE